MLKDELLQNLMDLGLTLVQAKVYLCLSKMDCACVKTVAKSSNLARQDVYRIMPSLEKMGLVEKVISNPVRYKAISTKEGLSRLLEHRIHEDVELQKKTDLLLTSLQEEKTKMPSADEEPQFIITSEVDLLFKRLIKTTQSAQKSIDSVGHWASFDDVVTAGFHDFQDALRRGVKIRSITEKPHEKKRMPRCVKTLQKSKLYTLKLISRPAPATMVITDKLELHICISGKAVPSLWTNNPAIVGLALNYFEELWKK